MNQWISVKEKLPELYEPCLCCVVIPLCGGNYSRKVKMLIFNGKNGWDCNGIIVTHWMHLPALPNPALPKEDENEP